MKLEFRTLGFYTKHSTSKSTFHSIFQKKSENEIKTLKVIHTYDWNAKIINILN